MLENLYEGLNNRFKLYFCKMYKTCVSSKLKMYLDTHSKFQNMTTFCLAKLNVWRNLFGNLLLAFGRDLFLGRITTCKKVKMKCNEFSCF